MSDNKPYPGFTSSPMLNAVAGLLALAVAMGIGRFAFTPVLPMMLDDAGVTIAQGALLASANYLGYLIGALMAIMVRIAPVTAIRAGLAGIAVTTLAMALPLPLAGWLAMRLLAGIASAWVLISVSAWSLDTLAKYQRPVLGSVVFAGVGSGIAAAGLICIVLLTEGATPSYAWLILGLLSVAVTGCIWPFFHRSGQAAAGTPSGTRTPYHWDAESIRMVLCYGLFGFGYIIPATFLPVMAKNALQDPSLFGWSWPVFGFAAALSTLSVAAVNRHVSSARLWMICNFVMAFGVVLPVLWSNLTTVFLAALFVGGTFMVITLTAMQEAKRVAGSDAPVLIAAMTSSFAAGQIAGPLSITYGFGRGGFSAALLAASVMLVLAGLILWNRPAVSRSAAG